MNLTLRISLIIALLIYFFSIVYFSKNKLELRFTILWLFFGIAMTIVVLFPAPFLKVMRLFGIIDEVNGLFAIMIFLLIILLVSLTSYLTKIHNDFRKLVQKCAMYEERLRVVEEKINHVAN